MKKVTHLEAQRVKAQELKEQVCQLMGCKEQEYCEYQFKVGKQFLQSYMPSYPVIIDELVDSKMYWSWWCNHWMLRDEAFLAHSQGLHRLELLQLYSELHDYQELVKELFPDVGLMLR